jgi:hypothetical protein
MSEVSIDHVLNIQEKTHRKYYYLVDLHKEAYIGSRWRESFSETMPFHDPTSANS